MKVTVLGSTPEPEKLTCIHARGDYFDGFVADYPFEELMEPVSVNQWGEKYVLDSIPSTWESIDDINNGWIREELRKDAKVPSLLHKLSKRGHFGPWEAPQITFGVKGVSRSCMAQITRHRHASFDVQSMRYVDFSDKEAVVPKSLQDEEHFSRESGVTEVENREELAEMYSEVTDELIEEYERMVDAGVPKEDARFILPIGMPVNMSISMNARALMHVFDMRKKPDAQWEVREMSNRMFELFREWMPITATLYEESAPHKLKP